MVGKLQAIQVVDKLEVGKLQAILVVGKLEADMLQAVLVVVQPFIFMDVDPIILTAEPSIYPVSITSFLLFFNH